jgi:DNA replication protein DnaC
VGTGFSLKFGQEGIAGCLRRTGLRPAHPAPPLGPGVRAPARRPGCLAPEGQVWRRAAFRATKTLEGFEFDRLPSTNRALVHDLATGRYIQEKAPVLIVGPCGTGKSHLAQALGHCAVRQGQDVVFASCAQLLASLNAARAIGNYERKLQQLARVPVLIIDDFGLKPLRAPADEDLHDLIAERYEQSATIVTSNLDFTEWDQAFPGNRLLASATVDRLRHNAYCLTLDGASYRAPRQGPNKVKTALASTPKNNQP